MPFSFASSPLFESLEQANVGRLQRRWCDSLRGRRFKREGKGIFGKGSFRRERNAPSFPPRAPLAFLSQTIFPFPFKRLPRRLAMWVRIFPVGWEAPEGKRNRAGPENCRSIVREQRTEGIILHHQLLKHGLCCRWNAYHQNLDRSDEMKHLPGAWIWKTFHYCIIRRSEATWGLLFMSRDCSRKRLGTVCVLKFTSA